MSQQLDQFLVYASIRRQDDGIKQHLKFTLRNSLYGINPNPPSIEELKELGAFDKEDNKGE